MKFERGARRAFWALVPIAVVTLLLLARDATFRIDDWELVGNRSLSDPIGLFRPYNDEWIATPALLFRIVFVFFGLSSYLPYVGLTLLAHIVAAERLRRLITSIAGPLTGFALGSLLLFLGSAGEVLNQAIGLGVVLPVAAGIWAIDETFNHRRTGRAALLLLLAVSSHPIGLVMLGCCLIVSPRSRRAVRPLLFVAGVVLGWAIAFELPALAGHSGSLTSNIPLAPAFVIVGVLAALGAILGLGPSSSILVLGGSILLAVKVARRPAFPVLVTASVAGLITEFVLIALLRAQFGAWAATSSRYMYPGVTCALIGLAAWFGGAAEKAMARRGWTAVLAAAVLAMAVAGNVAWYVEFRDVAAEAMHETRAATAIAMWQPNLLEWNQELHLPSPARLRALIAAHGDPDKDILVPSVVPPVPEWIARSPCVALVPQSPMHDCIQAIASAVGGR